LPYDWSYLEGADNNGGRLISELPTNLSCNSNWRNERKDKRKRRWQAGRESTKTRRTN